MYLFVVLLSLGYAYVAYSAWLKFSTSSRCTAFLSLFLACHMASRLPWIGEKIHPQIVTMLENIALYVCIPMATLLVLHCSLAWQWSAAAWGRIFLALAAAFEVSRHGHFIEPYSLAIAGCWVVCVTILMAKMIKHQQFFAVGVGASALAMSFIGFNTNPTNTQLHSQLLTSSILLILLWLVRTGFIIPKKSR